MLQTLYVIKIGGNIIDNPSALSQFLQNFASITAPKLLVHGGGKIATQIAQKLGIETQMVEGRRITDQAMLDVVTMVYGGLVNKKIVAQLQSLSCQALGLSGADAACIEAQKRPVKTIDYGFVGDIIRINDEIIYSFIKSKLTPIFAPLTYDKEGFMLNTNADTQASALAVAMTKHFEVKLMYCFEKKGVLSNPEDDDSIIKTITHTDFDHYKSIGVVSIGMIPKLENAFKAIENDVKEVCICHAQDILAAIQNEAGTRLLNS